MPQGITEVVGDVYRGHVFDIDRLVQEHYEHHPEISAIEEKGGDGNYVVWQLDGELVGEDREVFDAFLNEGHMALRYNAKPVAQALVRDGHLKPGLYVLLADH